LSVACEPVLFRWVDIRCFNISWFNISWFDISWFDIGYFDIEKLVFMNCAQCGDPCRCPGESLPPPLPSVNGVEEKRADPETGARGMISRDESVALDASPGPGATCQPPAEIASEVGNAQAWRNELSARVNRYRARRKALPPRYPSLNLRFEPFESAKGPIVTGGTPSLSTFEPISNHALALDGMTAKQASATEPIYHHAEHTPDHFTARASAKIIEFPRFAWGPPAPPPDQLAEPVIERPRILEVPEVEPPLPALGGITIEAIKNQEPEKRPGIDVPLQSAALGLRILAAAVDAIFISAASALFGFIFWRITAIRPPQIQIMGLAAGVPLLCWAAYEYLLLVYAASTPGTRLAGLELARFDGTATDRSLRRWRVLAAWLSAASLGMGYAWVFLDEDNLCWHDRITHTCLAPKGTGRKAD
jgi:hypothetical protein